MKRTLAPVFILVTVLGTASAPAGVPQGARARWELRSQILREKLDLVLPAVMRERGIDMWITMMKEGRPDPLAVDLGVGYASTPSFVVFTDRGGPRIERAALGFEGYETERCGAYDIVAAADGLAKLVRDRDPRRIAVDTSEAIGRADGLSHTGWLFLVKTLGEPYASRLVSAEELVPDFVHRRTAGEVALFAEAGRVSREIAQRALSNEVIVPGVTTLEDVAWWMAERSAERGLDLSFGVPSVYVTGPKGIEATSDGRAVRRGDLVMVDWGVGLMGYYTDMKRIAYVLKDGETDAPAGLRQAFARAVAARDAIRGALRPGVTGTAAAAVLDRALAAAGFAVMKEFNKPGTTGATEVFTGLHSVGDWGHGSGPSAAFFQPRQREFPIRPSTLLSIELFAWTPAPEWNGAKVRIPLEDDAVVTANGIEWLYPVNDRILLIR